MSVITLVAQLSLSQAPTAATPPAAPEKAPAAQPAGQTTEPEASPAATPAPPEAVPTESATAGTEPAAPAAAATETPTTPAEPAAAPVVPSKTKPRLLVLDLNDRGAGETVANALSETVAKQAAQSFVGEVVTPAQLQAILDRAMIQQSLGCDTENCMVNLGAQVEADVVLSGNVAAVGGDFLITVLAVDVKTGKRIGFEQRKVPDNNALYFYAAKQMTSTALTGRSVDFLVPVQFTFKGETDPRVVIDGKESQLDENNIVKLDPGQHEVKIDASGFDTWKSTLTVDEGTPLQITVELVSSRVPLWPVTATLGAASAASFIGFLAFGAIAQMKYGSVLNNVPGASSLFPYDQSYNGLKPASSAQLDQLESQSFLFAIIGDVFLGMAIVTGAAAAVVLAADVAWWALSE